MDGENKRRNKAEAGDADEELPEHRRSTSAMSSSGSTESEKSPPPTWKSYVFLLLLLAVYIGLNCIGGYVFQVIERNPKANQPHWFPGFKEDFVKNHSTSLSMDDLERFIQVLEIAMDQEVSTLRGNQSFYRDAWTFSSGFLLSFTIASTIGYGLVTPVTPGGQAFCIVFALFGIPLTGLLAAKIGSLMAYFIKKAAALIFRKKRNDHRAKVASILFTFFVGLLIYFIIPSLILNYVDNDENWSFLECLYCIFITLTTIGFGDYVPDPHSTGGMGANIFVLIWVVAGLAWFATIINLIATTLTKQATSIKKKVAHQKLTVKSIKNATANLGGHIVGRKYRSKTSLDSAGTGKSLKSNGKTSHPPSSIEEADCERSADKQPVTRADSKTSKGSAKVAWSKKRGSQTPSMDGYSPGSAHPSAAEDRRESRCSKRDDDLVLGPSGLMAVVMNNMEQYGDGDIQEESS